MYQKAKELADANGWFLARQFETADNSKIHENTTGREIVADFKGARLDYFVSGYGTGWDAHGRRPRPAQGAARDEDRPHRADQRGLGQQRSPSSPRSRQRPRGQPPRVDATPDPRMDPGLYSVRIAGVGGQEYYDQIVLIPGPAGIEWSRKLAAKEGIFTGISGGATFAATMQVAEKAPAGSVLLCMLPDTGERYLSSPLFEGIPEVMSPEETQLSQSTPGFQMQ